MQKSFGTWAVVAVLTGVLAWTGRAEAAFVPITGSGANSIIRSGVTMTGVVLDNVTFTTADLTQVTVTSWASASPGSLLEADTGLSTNNNLTRSPAQRRALIETDWRLDTGLINPSTTADSAGVSFNTPVANRPGVDLVIFEINPGTSADSIVLRINGQQQTVSTWGSTGYTTPNADVIKVRNTGNTADATPGSLTTLLNNPIQVNSVNIAQTVFGVGIDFSDFGVAANATVSSFTFWSTSTSTAVDPVIIAGIIPEPAAVAMVLTTLPALLARRHR